MVRSLDKVLRISREVSGPFGGLATHECEATTGPRRAVDCANVVLKDGRICRRDAATLLGTLPTDHRIESMHHFVSRQGAAVSNTVLVKLSTKASGYATGAVRVVADPEGVASVYAPVRYTGGAAFSDTLVGSHANFVEVPTGQYTSITECPAHQKTMFMLDGSTRVFKYTGHTDILTRVGLSAPVFSGSSGSAAGTLDNGTYSFKVSVMNYSARPEYAVADFPGQAHPGVEGNASSATSVTNTGTNGITLDFTTPDYQDEFWTHARLYCAITLPLGQTQYFLIGIYKRDAAYPTLSAQGGTLTNLAGRTSWRLAVVSCLVSPSTSLVDSQAAGARSYDYAPTRNLIPQAMHFFATWNGRGFYARRNERFVYYTDPVSIRSGGNYEHISGEAIEVGGNVTLLANFAGSLVIGSTDGTYVVNGTIGSLTNADAARGESSAPDSAKVEKIDDVGAVENGTGSYLIVRGLLYFVTKYGLAAFNGHQLLIISKPISGLLHEIPSSPSDFTPGTSGTLEKSTLSHDPDKRLIYLFVRRDGTWVGESDSSGGSFSQVFVYHYDQIDPLTGLGHWTRFTDIGSDAETGAFVHSGRRYTAFGMLRNEQSLPKFMVGMRNDQAAADDYHDAAIFLQNSGEDGDATIGSSDQNMQWFWESGLWDAGLPDRDKIWHFLTVRTQPLTGGTMNMGYNIGGGLVNTTEKSIATGSQKIAIGAASLHVKVRFGGGSLVSGEPSLAQVVSYALDAEALDGY